MDTKGPGNEWDRDAWCERYEEPIKRRKNSGGVILCEDMGLHTCRLGHSL